MQSWNNRLYSPWDRVHYITDINYILSTYACVHVCTWLTCGHQHKHCNKTFIWIVPHNYNLGTLEPVPQVQWLQDQTGCCFLNIHNILNAHVWITDMCTMLNYESNYVVMDESELHLQVNHGPQVFGRFNSCVCRPLLVCASILS